MERFDYPCRVAMRSVNCDGRPNASKTWRNRARRGKQKKQVQCSGPPSPPNGRRLPDFGLHSHAASVSYNPKRTCTTLPKFCSTSIRQSLATAGWFGSIFVGGKETLASSSRNFISERRRKNKGKPLVSLSVFRFLNRLPPLLRIRNNNQF